MEEQKIITFENVCKEYRIGDSSFFALKDASFAIKEGNFVVILGPSGAGKARCSTSCLVWIRQAVGRSLFLTVRSFRIIRTRN